MLIEDSLGDLGIGTATEVERVGEEDSRIRGGLPKDAKEIGVKLGVLADFDKGDENGEDTGDKNRIGDMLSLVATGDCSA